MPKYPVPEDFLVGRRADRDREYYGHATRYLETLKVKGHRVLDLGASTGDFSLQCLQQGARHVSAVEDEEEYWSIIAHNLRRYPKQFRLYRGACTSEVQTFTRRLTGDKFQFSDLLDESMATVLKCDIEGHEFEIFNDECLELCKEQIEQMYIEWHVGGRRIPEAVRIHESLCEMFNSTPVEFTPGWPREAFYTRKETSDED